MIYKTLMRAGAIALVVMLTATPAGANMGIPSIVGLSWIGMFLALIPVVIIEALVLWLRGDLSGRASFWVMTVANLASTFIGIPIACLGLYTLRPRQKKFYDSMLSFLSTVMGVIWLNSFEMESVYNHPYNRKKLFKLALTVGSVFVMGLYFAASWISEYTVASYMVTGIPPEALNDGIFVANAVTYGMMMALIAGFVIWSHMTTDHSEEFSGFDRAREKGSFKEWYEQRQARKDAEAQRTGNLNAAHGIRALKAAETAIAKRSLVVIEDQAQAGKTRLRSDEAQRGIAAE